MSVVLDFAVYRHEKALKTSPDVDLEKLATEVMVLLRSRAEEAPEPPARIAGGGIHRGLFNTLEARVKSLETSGTSASVNYLTITEAGTTTYTAAELPAGLHVIGVNAPGPVTIQLPNTLSEGTQLFIKDESLSALTNNITVTTYKES